MSNPLNKSLHFPLALFYLQLLVSNEPGCITSSTHQSDQIPETTDFNPGIMVVFFFIFFFVLLDLIVEN